MEVGLIHGRVLRILKKTILTLILPSLNRSATQPSSHYTDPSMASENESERSTQSVAKNVTDSETLDSTDSEEEDSDTDQPSAQRG